MIKNRFEQAIVKTDLSNIIWGDYFDVAKASQEAKIDW